MILTTTDLHLNLREDDRYRWSFMKKLKKIVSKHKAEALFILGDLTHDKDRHSSELVNRISDILFSIAQKVPIYVLKGNHDYIDPSNPFLRFLDKMENITFIVSPLTLEMENKNLLFLPHTRDPITEWKELDYEGIHSIFIHQSVDGAVASNGMELEGFPRNFFRDLGFEGRVYSGDIHVPQKIGKITYVGTPYAVHFGDIFSPRVMLLDLKKDKVKMVPSKGYPSKISLSINSLEEMKERLKEIGAKEGDYIKIKYLLPRSDFPIWKEIKRDLLKELHSRKIQVKGIEIKEIKRKEVHKKQEAKKSKTTALTELSVLEKFSDKEGIGSDLFKYGIDLL